MLKIISLFLFISLANCWDENTYFANTADLSRDVNIKWNFTTEDIYFRLNIKTNGWVGFGLSPNGGMLNSDVIIAWTDPDGTAQFENAHTYNRNIAVNRVRTWSRLFYAQANGATTVIFTRKLKICRTPEKTFIETTINVEPTSFVIFAHGANFVDNKTFPAYHGSTKGSKNLPLLVANKKIQLDMSEIEEVKFEVNVTGLLT